MQLKGKRQIRGAVAALSAALLGTPLAASYGGNHSESSLLIYSEKGKMKATEANFTLQKELRNGYSLNLGLSYDGLTGATPTGATPSKKEQTVSRTSGGRLVTVPAGAIPLDDSFNDRRFGAMGSLSRQVGKDANLTLGSQVSSEHDYTSLGINTEFTQDLNRKNTTLGVALSYSHDAVFPVGGFYDPYAEVGEERPNNTDHYGVTKRIKNVYDAVFGLTQVLDPKTIVRMNYSIDRARGYLTDPYKLITVVKSAADVDAGEPVNDVHEKRPDYRTKNALFGEIRRQMLGSVVNLSYRYFWDNWGINSHSVDFYFRVDFKKRGAMQPHIRWYRQSKADFSRPFLVQGQSLPNYASADSRLAQFSAMTYGLNYSIPVNSNSHLNLTAEYYAQRGDRSPPEAFGSLTTLNLFPDLDAVMLRAGYAHDF